MKLESPLRLIASARSFGSANRRLATRRLVSLSIFDRCLRVSTWWLIQPTHRPNVAV